MFNEIQKLFLGNAPSWYKSIIIGFLIINPILYAILNSIGLNGNFIIGWVFLLEFIFTLALALKCYPLQPGGLLALEAIIMGLTSTKSVFHEISGFSRPGIILRDWADASTQKSIMALVFIGVGAISGSPHS